MIKQPINKTNSNIQVIYHLWLALATLLILSLATSLLLLFFEPLFPATNGSVSNQPSGLALIVSITGSILFSYGLLVWMTREYFIKRFKPLLKSRFRWILVSVLTGVAIAVLINVVSHYYPPQPGDVSTFSLIKKDGAVAVVVLFVATVWLAPMFEEYLFRGLLYDSLLQRFGTIVAICASAVVFMGFHLIEYSDYWVGMSAILLLGIFLALLRQYSRSILGPILCHASYNASILLLA
mgnify:CR=1 FL=1